MLFGHQRISLIILTIFFMGLVLTTFYFTYAAKVEKQVVSRQMSLLTNDLIKDIPFDINKEEGDVIKKIVASIPIPNSVLADDVSASESNKKIEKNAFIVFGTLASLSAIGVILYGYNKDDVRFSVLFADLFFILLGVAGVEFLFLYFFASRYYPVDSNWLKYKFWSSL